MVEQPSRCPEGDTHKGGCYGRGMAAKHSRHIALTGPLAQYVERQVSAGEYASASEMIRAALRLLIERDQVRAKPASNSGSKTGARP